MDPKGIVLPHFINPNPDIKFTIAEVEAEFIKASATSIARDETYTNKIPEPISILRAATITDLIDIELTVIIKKKRWTLMLKTPMS